MNVIFKMNCVCFLKTTDLFNILHPLGHLGVAHVVDILDEGVILLPERHLLAVGVLKEGTIKTILDLCHHFFFHFVSPRYEDRRGKDVDGPDIQGREQPELPQFSRSLEATMARERRKVRHGAVLRQASTILKATTRTMHARQLGKQESCRSENARRGQGVRGSPGFRL